MVDKVARRDWEARENDEKAIQNPRE